MPQFLDKSETESIKYLNGKFLSWRSAAQYLKQNQAHKVLYLHF